MKRLLVLMVLTWLCAAPAGAAETVPWDALSSDEQRVLQRLQDRWNDLPAQRQQTLRKGVARWQSMTPEQRQRCLLYTSPSPRDGLLSRMPSSA